MRPTRRGPTLIVALTVAAVVATSTAAIATSSFQHTVGTNWHGHSVPAGGGTHVWTEHDGGSKHASADVFPTTDSVCAVTSSIDHVHCDTAVGISQIWGHHTDISNHHH
jgi:hypothetical protein